jgi:hypothetical protein
MYRRVYVAAVVLLASPPGGEAARQMCADLGIPRRTLLRWQHWWTQEFLHTDFGKAARVRFMPSLVGKELPLSLLDRFDAADPADRVAKVLKFISPLSICPAEVVK